MNEQNIPTPPMDPEQLVDPKRCYVCSEDATAVCAHCQMPICEEHREDTRISATRLTVPLCDECADKVEGLIIPNK